MSPRRLLLIAAATALIAGCAKPRVQTTQAYVGGSMPRPDRVLVSYFVVAPDQVRLDQGVAARAQRALGGDTSDAELMQAAQETQAALASHLVRRLQEYGLPAQLGDRPEGAGSVLLVRGQFVAINEGNRTRRLLIGLGAGKSSVSADAQLYYATSTEPPRFLTAFEGTANSGRMPGAAETMGAGAAAQTLGTSAVVTAGTHAVGESRRDTDTGEAGSLANVLALRIGGFAASQGWIPATAIK